MRKTLVILILLSVSFIKANAQTEKGTIMLGGGASLQISDGSTLFVLNPNLGVFFMNNVAVGGQVVVVASDGDNAWAIGPFIRGYFLGSDRGKLFAQGGFNVGGAEDSDVRVGFGLGLGYAVFVNQSIALEFGAFYNRTGNNDGIFTLGVGFQIHYKKR